MADRYRPSGSSRREDFQRKGISPPPRESGTRLFTSQRKSRPIPGRNSGHAPGAILKKGNSARQMQTRSKTRLHEKFSAKDMDQLDAQLNMLAVPLEDRPSMESTQSKAMDLDLPAALRAPFKGHIANELCPYSFCPVTTPHFEGLYLHNDQLSKEGPHGFFGALNPPPEIKEAYARISAQQGSESDYLTIKYFVMCHPASFELCHLSNWDG